MIAFFLVILFFLLFNYYLLGFRSQRPVSGAIFSLSPVFLGLPFLLPNNRAAKGNKSEFSQLMRSHSSPSRKRSLSGLLRLRATSILSRIKNYIYLVRRTARNCNKVFANKVIVVSALYFVAAWRDRVLI